MMLQIQDSILFKGLIVFHIFHASNYLSTELSGKPHICHILLIHSCDHKHLDSFHILAIVQVCNERESTAVSSR